MDRAIYTAGNGASRILEQQSALSNNLANISTPGFRAQMANYRSTPVISQEMGNERTTRVMTVATTADSLMAQGAFMTTGRALDVAIQGEGWFAVRAIDGSEAYTRGGSLQINSDGLLVTSGGLMVLSEDGQPIEIPNANSIGIERSGGINVLGDGDAATEVQRVASLKIADAANADLVRGEDGLFRALNGQGEPYALPAMEQPTVLSGGLEGSNVSAAESMIGLIQNARRFELQMKMIKELSTIEQSGNSLLSSSS
ncbi:Putative proximal rod protein [Oligella ureolytica]|uniref:Flagellar basal-body rod protein FlgF n=1 Tax=Oligella ureolytica TaxID=90244 RepID=A0A378XGI8_9BURK|nr:flagellar basal body rod protein FlgF [Oligella ureolytica]QPT39110.1 flagellar basal body rod protein FlgF [Oligella ureolytica]SUA54830.1 Putative proximal rod protein [Oligella ureolytica]SUA56026.1 Putative proximal rod protein [Oligella ureolytica]